MGRPNPDTDSPTGAVYTQADPVSITGVQNGRQHATTICTVALVLIHHRHPLNVVQIDGVPCDCLLLTTDRLLHRKKGENGPVRSWRPDIEKLDNPWRIW